MDDIVPTKIALSCTLKHHEKKKHVCNISDAYDTIKCSFYEISKRC